jgi:transposase
MIKYSEHFKISVIEHYETGIAGYRIVGQHFGVAPAIVRRWVLWHRAHGIAGLTKQHTSYSAKFKASVLQHMWDNSLSQTQTAAFFNVRNTSSIGQWERRFLSGGIEALVRTSRKQTTQLNAPTSKPPPPVDAHERSREDILAELDHLRMEVAVLKKLQALAQARKKLQAPKKR